MLKFYGKGVFLLYDYHKFPHAVLPTTLPSPQDEYTTDTAPNTSAYIVSDPRTAKTSVPFYGFSPLRFCPRARFLL